MTLQPQASCKNIYRFSEQVSRPADFLKSHRRNPHSMRPEAVDISSVFQQLNVLFLGLSHRWNILNIDTNLILP